MDKEFDNLKQSHHESGKVRRRERQREVELKRMLRE